MCVFVSNINTKNRYNSKRRGEINSQQTIIYNDSFKTNDDIYVITQEGDRLDNLASEYYGDANLWWFIARVNNLKINNVEAGTRLRIPPSADNAKGK